MGIFASLFNKKKQKENLSENLPKKDLSEHRSYLDSLRKQSIGIFKTEEKNFSKIGGLATLPPDFQWPTWNGKSLAFLCQLDMSSIPDDSSFGELPRSGALYFFYDQEQSTWGFDPKDRRSWRVLYSEHIQDAKECSPPGDLDAYCIYKEKFIQFSKIFTYPNWEDKRVEKLDLIDTQIDEYIELCSAVFENQPNHHLFGNPSPIQGNQMDLECQLVSHGLYCGDSSGYEDPKAKELEEGRKEWILLLQLDSDEDTEMMWGDVGMLYFWIRTEDLEKKNFDNVWMILQCG